MAAIALVLLSLRARPASAQAPAPAAAAPAPAQPSAPPSPVNAIRLKLSAGDLLSAESVLEVHHDKYGEDGPWLQGLGWLARGAWLTGDPAKAARYAAQVREACAKRLAAGAKLATDHDVENALGAAIEVEAQQLERTRGRKAAAAYVREQLAANPGPTAFLSRLHRQLDLLTLAGSPAPELAIEDWVGDRPPTLASLRGKPVLLFLWAEWCGDCKAQSAALGHVVSRHLGSDLQCVAVTRYYEPDSARVAEKARVDSVWATVYPSVGAVPRVLSTASMIEYGVSSTPTFAFIDRAGIVRRYAPTRLTEDELEREVEALLR